MDRGAWRCGRRTDRTQGRVRVGGSSSGILWLRVFRRANSRARIVGHRPGTSRAIGRGRRRILRGRDRATGKRSRALRCAVSFVSPPFFLSSFSSLGFYGRSSRKLAPSGASVARLPLAESWRESIRGGWFGVVRGNALVDRRGLGGGIRRRTCRGSAGPFRRGRGWRGGRRRLRGRGSRVLWGGRAFECLSCTSIVGWSK